MRFVCALFVVLFVISLPEVKTQKQTEKPQVSSICIASGTLAVEGEELWAPRPGEDLAISGYFSAVSEPPKLYAALSNIVPNPGRFPGKSNMSGVNDTFSQRGFVDGKTGQYTALYNFLDFPQVAEGASLPIAAWHGSRSYNEGVAPDYPAWPRALGERWRLPWDECLIHSTGSPGSELSPGDPVTRICPFGLVIVNTVNRALTQKVYIKTKSGTREVTEYCYSPAIDGTRLIFEVPPEQEEGVWFKQYRDGSRVEYERAGGSTRTNSHWRIKREYKGAYLSPDWEITYTWNEDGVLSQITDTREIVYSFQYNSSPIRLNRIEVDAPWTTGQTPDFTIRFTYNDSNRLERVIGPARQDSTLYDWDHDGAYEAGETTTSTYYASTKYSYTDGFITGVTRELLSNFSPVVVSKSEAVAVIDYESGTPWRVEQIKWVKAQSTYQTHSFSYSAVGNIQRVTWTDPIDRVKKYDSVQWPNTTTALQRSITKVIHEPSISEPSGANTPTLTWDLTWKTSNPLLLEKIEGPYQGTETNPFTVQYAYDSAGRGLVTSTTTTPRGGGTAIARSWTYSDWGDGFEDPDTPENIRLVSRLTGYTDATSHSTSLSYAVNTPGILATVSLPENLSFQVQGDPMGRVLWQTEPGFTAYEGGSSATSYNKTKFTYGTSASTADYGLVNEIIRFLDASESTEVKTRVSYTGFGFPEQINQFNNYSSLVRKVRLSYNDGGHIDTMYLPSPTTGNSHTSSDIEFTRDHFGKVLKSKRRALDESGLAYANTWIENIAYFDRLGRRVRVTVERSVMDTQSSSTDPADWLEYTWTYDDANRVVKVQGPWKDYGTGNEETVHEIQYVFDSHDFVFQIKKLLDTDGGNSYSTAVFDYGVLGNIAETIDGTNLKHIYTPDGFGRIIQIENKGTDNSGDKKITIEYDEESRIKVKKSYQGTTVQSNILKIFYDDLGRVETKRIYDHTENIILASIDYTFDGFRTHTVRNKEGRGTDYYYDPRGLIYKIEDTLSSNNKNAIAVNRNATGDITQLTEYDQKESSWGGFGTPVAYVRKFYYDRRSRMTELENYGSGSQVLSERHFTYDLLDRLIKSRDYSLQNDSLASHKYFTHEYDALGRNLKQIIWPNDGTPADKVELSTQYIDIPLDSGSLHATLGFELRRIDDRSNVTVFQYDRGGRPYERRVPGYTGTYYRWRYNTDNEGRITGWTDGNGAVVTIGYNNEMLPISRTATEGAWTLSPMTTYEKLDYDSMNRVDEMETLYAAWGSSAPRLTKINRSYYDDGRLFSESFKWFGLATAKTLTSGWAIPAPGTGEDFDFRRSLSLSSGWDLDFTPDGVGKLDSIALESPGSNTAYNLAAYRYEGQKVLGRKLFYDTQNNFFDEARSFNTLGHLIGITTDSGNTMDEDIYRDWLGNVLKVAYARPGSQGGDAYKLDKFDRLVDVKIGISSSDMSTDYDNILSWGDRRLHYVLDKAHNRDKVNKWDNQGQPLPSDDYTQGTGNRYAAFQGVSLTYDYNGNLVFDGQYVYVYDYLDRLCEVWEFSSLMLLSEARSKGLTRRDIEFLLQAAHKAYPTAQILSKGIASLAKTATTTSLVPVVYYGYDPQGRRVIKFMESGTLTYTWDGWRRAEEYEDSSGNGTGYTILRAFFDGAGIDEHIGYAVTDDGGTTWTRYTFLQGQLGHVRAVADNNGQIVERYLYDPYGKRTVYDANWNLRSNGTVVSNDYGYTGRTHDAESGLVYYRLRYNHPILGRFLNYDLIGIWGDLSNWGNGYGYCGNVPTRFKDPFGLFIGLLAVLGNHQVPRIQQRSTLNTEQGWLDLANKLHDKGLKAYDEREKLTNGMNDKDFNNWMEENKDWWHDKFKKNMHARAWIMWFLKKASEEGGYLVVVIDDNLYEGKIENPRNNPATAEKKCFRKQAEVYTFTHGTPPLNWDYRIVFPWWRPSSFIRRPYLYKWGLAVLLEALEKLNISVSGCTVNSCFQGMNNPNRQENAATITADMLGMPVISPEGLGYFDSGYNRATSHYKSVGDPSMIGPRVIKPWP